MVSIVLLTYNAERYINKLLDSLYTQTLKEFELIIIDSSSTDGTQEHLKARNIEFVEISSIDFNHGGTRSLGLELAKNNIVVYMTQDALPYDKYCLENLVAIFEKNENISISVGRQIPYLETDVFGKFARLYNYPEESNIRSKTDISKYGIKTFFNSNSFAAYRKECLLEMGGFPKDIIMCEDSFVAAKLILQGHKILYCANAMVYHSHTYNLKEEFKRYFDIGVAYGSNKWMLDEFVTNDKEGLKFYKKETEYLIKNNKGYLIPKQLIRNIFKYSAYKIGLKHKILPIWIKKKISMHPKYWK